MSTEAETLAEYVRRLQVWASDNNSLIVQTPSERYYALFFEPDGEGPRMQFMGSSLVRAYSFIRNHPTNRYK